MIVKLSTDNEDISVYVYGDEIDVIFMHDLLHVHDSAAIF